MYQVGSLNSLFPVFSHAVNLDAYRFATELVTKNGVATKKKLAFLHSRGKLADILKAVGMDEDDADMLISCL